MWQRLWFPEVSQVDAMRGLLREGHGGLTPEDDARRRVVVRFAEPDKAKVQMAEGRRPWNRG